MADDGYASDAPEVRKRYHIRHDLKLSDKNGRTYHSYCAGFCRYPVLISFTSTDIRPNNVFVDYDVKSDGSIRVNQAQISDLEMGGLTEEEMERSVARRLLSHFGDSPGLVGLVEHLDYNTALWRDLVLDVTKEFSPENPRKPFSMWEDFDEYFRDLIMKMTSLDPARGITAREALDILGFRMYSGN
ncbi:conserved hypothetical protein [Histoplasma capsulatum var. duboisii H88]|uniref:Protein kinase domain-containing protein n=1 Tax=Ajellomyces capsulatus (strain H88) TaxID=544711 RepID=F0UQD7_AJEC8|nr:conserved hypothetical protein [Histoplasma capsulatum var. duboisii H88]